MALPSCHSPQRLAKESLHHYRKCSKVPRSNYIGDDVAIGADAAVITDVPSNSIAVGIPAKIRPRKQTQAVAADAILTEQKTDQEKTCRLDTDAGSAVIAATHQEAGQVRVRSKVCDRSP
jgi:hypothetical protein